MDVSPTTTTNAKLKSTTYGKLFPNRQTDRHILSPRATVRAKIPNLGLGYSLRFINFTRVKSRTGDPDGDRNNFIH